MAVPALSTRMETKTWVTTVATAHGVLPVFPTFGPGHAGSTAASNVRTDGPGTRPDRSPSGYFNVAKYAATFATSSAVSFFAARPIFAFLVRLPLW